MTVKQLISITSDIKHHGKPFSHKFKAGCNVYCALGASGSGKTALENSVRLALLKRAWVDILGKEIKQPKMLSERLNQGGPINIKLQHNKGESCVNLKPSKHGRYPRELPHTGYFPPVGGNLAATLKDILSRTPATMIKMLVDLVVANVTKKDMLAAVDSEAAQNVLAAELSKPQSTVDALNAAIDSVAASIKDAQAELKPLVMANDPGAYEVSAVALSSAIADRDFWVTQKGLYDAHSRKSDAEIAEQNLRGELDRFRKEVAGLLLEEEKLPKVDAAKIEAYFAGASLCDFAAAKDMKACPICSGTDGMHSTMEKKGYAPDEEGAPQRFFGDKAAAFRGLATHANTDPNAAYRRSLKERVEGLRTQINRAEFALERVGSAIASSKPDYSIEHIEEYLASTTTHYEDLLTAQNRHNAQVERTKSIEKINVNIKKLTEIVDSLKKVKKTLVDAAFGEFLERTRYFLPDSKALRGGILHINLERREVGFLRNGRMSVDPSGSELRVIVVSMALAAGSAMREPPPIFLDDVGWGVELLEGSLNAWSKYEGIVWVSSTAKVRSSKVNEKVELIKIKEVTTHTSTEILPIAVKSELKWAHRPEDNYKVSMFAQAFASLEVGSNVVVVQKHREGRGYVEQEFESQVVAASKKNVTVMTTQGVGFTISKVTGEAPHNGHTYVKSIEESALLTHYRAILCQFLGYSPSWSPSLEQVIAIWENQISADDLQARADLVPGLT